MWSRRAKTILRQRPDTFGVRAWGDATTVEGGSRSRGRAAPRLEWLTSAMSECHRLAGGENHTFAPHRSLPHQRERRPTEVARGWWAPLRVPDLQRWNMPFTSTCEQARPEPAASCSGRHADIVVARVVESIASIARVVSCGKLLVNFGACVRCSRFLC